MSKGQNNNSAVDSEELETDEKEQFLLQIDEWLKVFLDDMFSNLIEDDLTEADGTEEPLGE